MLSAITSPYGASGGIENDPTSATISHAPSLVPRKQASFLQPRLPVQHRGERSLRGLPRRCQKEKSLPVYGVIPHGDTGLLWRLEEKLGRPCLEDWVGRNFDGHQLPVGGDVVQFLPVRAPPRVSAPTIRNLPLG